VVDFLFVVTELFSLSAWLRCYKQKFVEVSIFRRGWSDCPFVQYQNICSVLFGFVTKHACDRQTDVQTEVRQDHASIAATCGKKPVNISMMAVRLSTCTQNIAGVISYKMTWWLTCYL